MNDKQVVQLKLSEEAMGLLEQQRQAFREKFGRDPLPEDPVWFDPDSAKPRPLTRQKFKATLVTAMRKAGTDPAFIHAFRKTGILVTATNVLLFSPEEVEQWTAAVEEYRQRNPQRYLPM